ncbi:uncharacterized protein [Drosophila tropicalis]|uniref:uncharacterized protein n=1 Tax=Drosophila tropicalis TaxID=46794 RepID=UPI0035ABF6BD
MANNARQNNCLNNRSNQLNDIVLRQFYDASQMAQAHSPQQQSYSFVAQQHLPQYYEPSQPEMGVNNMINYNMTPILAQGSIPSWYSSYQQQQVQHPYTTYNNCYDEQQHRDQNFANGSNRMQFVTEMGGMTSQPFNQSISGGMEQQPTAVIYRQQSGQGSQMYWTQMPTKALRPKAGGRARCPIHDNPRTYLRPFPLDCSTSLNRSFSVNSFRDHRGSRIRDSQQDMEEYRRIAARNLRKSRKNRTTTMNNFDDNASIKSNMSSGAVRFLKRLRMLLKLRSDKGSLFSLLRKRTKSQPKYPSSQPKRTKQRFFKSLFDEVESDNLHARQKSLANKHYPTDPALVSMQEHDVQEAVHFKKLRDKAKKEKQKYYH